MSRDYDYELGVRSTAVCRTGAFEALFCATAVLLAVPFFAADFGAAFDAAGFLSFKADATVGAAARRLDADVFATRSPG